MDEPGLLPPHRRVLAFLASDGPSLTRDVASALYGQRAGNRGTAAGTLRVLDWLRARGLVRDEFLPPGRGGLYRWSLTDDGAEMARGLLPLRKCAMMDL